MNRVKSVLDEAKDQPGKESLLAHVETIKTLREKNYSWRAIADFLRANGVETDHTKIFRFMKSWASDKSVYVDFFVPTAEQYAKALEEIAMTVRQRAMLLFHFHAHNRTVTFTQLAQAGGYEDYATANLQYGKLGRTLGEELDMVFAKSLKRGQPFYSSAIGADNPFKSADSEYELVMHHELAKAIQLLGWATDGQSKE